MRTALVLSSLLVPALAGAGTFTYPGAFKAALLHEQLLAAFPGQEIRVESTAAMVRITVPDTILQASVDAVVAAHNPALPSAGEVLEQKVLQARADLKAAQPADLDAVLAQVDAAFPDPAQRTIIRRLLRAVYFLVRERRADE
jgi:hypothetical protein